MRKTSDRVRPIGVGFPESLLTRMDAALERQEFPPSRSKFVQKCVEKGVERLEAQLDIRGKKS